MLKLKTKYKQVFWPTQQGKERRIEIFGRGRREGVLLLKEFCRFVDKEIRPKEGSVAFSDGAPHFVVCALPAGGL